MKYKVVIQPDAELELYKIKDWLLKRSPTASVNWFEGLIENINLLDEMPFRYPIVHTVTLPKDSRCMIYNPYKIYFTVKEDKVYILHIRHTALPPL